MQNEGGLYLTVVGHAAGTGQVHTMQDCDYPTNTYGDDSHEQ